jgi:hypothetical protein
MASYLQGTTDYIPQIQPFQPDYNFLGNVLQAKQSKYDVAHKQLNKMYGTLLYSPMSREDNIQQRDNFLQAIDQDIKKMSGLDLSLQENVDAASSVFKSIYDNKAIVKDMTHTKQFQDQLQTAENYKNCLNQDDCGGGYWNEGVMAMKYRMDEYKKASASDAMNMAAPTYTPFINVAEKAVKYTEDLLKNKFGVSTVNWSPDGKYIVTTLNGKNLTVPLYQLMQNQFAQDPKIQEMYNTQAYVNKKGYIAQNAERFGGDEAAAENDYINVVQQQVDLFKKQAVEQQQKTLGAQNTKLALEQKIKREGTTGTDDLADSYKLADIDYTQLSQTANHYDQTAKMGTSIASAGDNIKIKSANVDAFVARSLMENAFREAAINVSNLTGETSVKEDPYAKSYYDHSLAMAKMDKEYQYKTKFEIDKARIDLMKAEAKGEYDAKGPANSNLNVGVYEDATTGTSASTEKTDEQIEMQNYVKEHQTIADVTAKKYVDQSTTYLQNIINDPKFSAEEKAAAKTNLVGIWGKHYNTDKNTFVGNDGKPTDYSLLLAGPEVFTTYGKAVANRNNGKNQGLYKDFYEETLDPIANTYNDTRKVMDISSQVFRENNLNVKSFAVSSDQYLDNDERDLFKVLFKNNGDIRSKEEYMAIGLTEDTYDDMTKIYNQVYNSGLSIGPEGNKKPLVKAYVDANSAFGMYAEGKSAGGSVRYGFDASNGTAFGTRGLVTFGDNAINSRNALFSAAPAASADDAISGEDAANYRLALNSVVGDIKSGRSIGKKGLTEDRAFGTVKYLDVALSDPNYKAIHIDFSPSYMNKWKGTKEDKGWGSDANIKQNGITVYIPKDEANNDFTTAFKQKANDLILNYKPITLKKPEGGEVTITKQESGQFAVTGAFKSYTGNMVNGKLEYTWVNPSKIYSSDVGGDNLVRGIEARLNEIDIANKNYAAGKNPRMYDVNSLPSMGSQFEQGGQGSSVDRFNQLIGQ